MSDLIAKVAIILTNSPFSIFFDLSDVLASEILFHFVVLLLFGFGHKLQPVHLFVSYLHFLLLPISIVAYFLHLGVHLCFDCFDCLHLVPPAQVLVLLGSSKEG